MAHKAALLLLLQLLVCSMPWFACVGYAARTSPRIRHSDSPAPHVHHSPSPAPNATNTLMPWANSTNTSMPWANSTNTSLPLSNTTNTTGVSRMSTNRGIRAIGLSHRRDNLTELYLLKAAQDATAFIASTPSSFYQANLDTHNAYRARHTSTNQLAWDDAAANSAAAYASRCIWGHDPSNSVYGENLYAFSEDSDQAQFQADGLKAWYDEICLYDYAHPAFSEAAGHFTQMVWRGSTRLGCAVQRCNGMTNWPAGHLYLVCRYSPPGNYAGQFGSNVGVVSSSASSSATATVAPAPAPAAPAPAQQQTSYHPISVQATMFSQGRVLSEGTCLFSPNRRYRLCMQTYGQLQLLKSGSLLWSKPDTPGVDRDWVSYKMTVKANGRLAVTSETSTPGMMPSAVQGFDFMPLLRSVGQAPVLSTVWTSNNSPGVSPYTLLLRDDGNVLLVDNRNSALWQTGTANM